MADSSLSLNPELLDDLQACLIAHVHYYNGILESIKEGSYTAQSALTDFQALMDGEQYGAPTGLLYELASDAGITRAELMGRL